MSPYWQYYLMDKWLLPSNVQLISRALSNNRKHSVEVTFLLTAPNSNPHWGEALSVSSVYSHVNNKELECLSISSDMTLDHLTKNWERAYKVKEQSSEVIIILIKECFYVLTISELIDISVWKWADLVKMALIGEMLFIEMEHLWFSWQQPPQVTRGL